jgi:hypothetical protein
MLHSAEVPLEAVVEDEDLAALGEGEDGVLDSAELDEEDGKPQKKAKGKSAAKGKTAAKKQGKQAASEASSNMQVGCCNSCVTACTLSDLHWSCDL